MGRDNAVNVETTRKQIYHRSTREYIYRSLYYIMPVKPITGLRNDTKTCFDPLIQSILSLTPCQINCNGWSRKMKESLRHITDTNRVLLYQSFFSATRTVQPSQSTSLMTMKPFFFQKWLACGLSLAIPNRISVLPSCFRYAHTS